MNQFKKCIHCEEGKLQLVEQFRIDLRFKDSSEIFIRHEYVNNHPHAENIFERVSELFKHYKTRILKVDSWFSCTECNYNESA